MAELDEEEERERARLRNAEAAREAEVRKERKRRKAEAAKARTAKAKDASKAAAAAMADDAVAAKDPAGPVRSLFACMMYAGVSVLKTTTALPQRKMCHARAPRSSSLSSRACVPDRVRYIYIYILHMGTLQSTSASGFRV